MDPLSTSCDGQAITFQLNSLYLANILTPLNWGAAAVKWSPFTQDTSSFSKLLLWTKLLLQTYTLHQNNSKAASHYIHIIWISWLFFFIFEQFYVMYLWSLYKKKKLILNKMNLDLNAEAASLSCTTKFNCYLLELIRKNWKSLFGTVKIIFILRRWEHFRLFCSNCRTFRWWKNSKR